MGNYILALNCGSSSLKFTLFTLLEDNQLEHYISGVVEEIGNTERSRIKLEKMARSRLRIFRCRRIRMD